MDYYGNKIKDRETKFAVFLTEINKFHAEIINYLSEFKLDNKKIEESNSKADDHIKEMESLDALLKVLTFDGKLMEFNKNESELNTSLLGSLQHLSFDDIFFREFQVNNGIFDDFECGLDLFRLENGTAI